MKRKEKNKDLPCGPFIFLRKPCEHSRYCVTPCFIKKTTPSNTKASNRTRTTHRMKQKHRLRLIHHFFLAITYLRYNKPFVKALRPVFIQQIVYEGCICEPHGSINVIYPSIWLVRSARSKLDSAPKIIHAYKMDSNYQIGPDFNRTFLDFHWKMENQCGG